jgi:hypothetical protein
MSKRIKFQFYDYENPQIWDHFESIALNLIGKGVQRYGAKSIMEVIRFHVSMDNGEGVKINNNYNSDYARKFIKKYPQHSNFFEFRTLLTKER